MYKQQKKLRNQKIKELAKVIKLLAVKVKIPILAAYYRSCTFNHYVMGLFQS